MVNTGGGSVQYFSLQRIIDAATIDHSDAEAGLERLANGETLNQNDTADRRLLSAIYVADGGNGKAPGIIARGMRKLGYR